MSENNTEQLIKDHLKTLPKPVKDAIASFDWTREVFSIGQKKSLHVDAIGEIQTEVMLVVLGLISPKEFYDQMVSRIGIKDELALEIADEVNEKVFVRIRNFMKNYYAEQEKKDKEIVSSERNVLKNAGIKLGDEPDEDQKVESSQNKVDNKEVSIKVAPLPDFSFEPKQESVSVSPVPDISAKLQNPQVFKGKSTSYLDPYREPIE